MLDHRSADSDHRHVGDFGWTRDRNRFGWQAMLAATADGMEVSPYASPARATDLSGLPPTYIHVGSVDLFLEECLDYARRLTRDGVAVELHVWPGAYHGFRAIDSHVTRASRAAAHASLQRALYAPLMAAPL
jgi:acetyl esterase/lipase